MDMDVSEAACTCSVDSVVASPHSRLDEDISEAAPYCTEQCSFVVAGNDVTCGRKSDDVMQGMEKELEDLCQMMEVMGLPERPAPAHSQSEPPLSQELQLIFTNNDQGYNSVHMAVLQHDVNTLIELLKICKDPDLLNLCDDFGRTALHLALLEDNLAALALLILGGGSVRSRNEEGNTVLHTACTCNGDRPLLTTVWVGVRTGQIVHGQLPQILNSNNYQGLSTFHLAAEADNRLALHRLQQLGADINAKDCKSGRTALHKAVRDDNLQLVHFLLRNLHVDVQTLTFSRHSALDIAANSGTLRQLLLECGAERGTFSDSDSELSKEESSDSDAD